MYELQVKFTLRDTYKLQSGGLSLLIDGGFGNIGQRFVRRFSSSRVSCKSGMTSSKPSSSAQAISVPYRDIS